MQFTKPVIELFEALLNDFKLSANDPQFVLIAQRVALARDELNAYHQTETQQDKPAESVEPEAKK